MQDRPIATELLDRPADAAPPPEQREAIRLAVPKGRMHDGIVRLLEDAGIRLVRSARDYRPSMSLPGWSAKVLKPQAVVEMLSVGARDVGFAGADWVAELGADVIEILDTGLDRVRVVAAAPPSLIGADGRPTAGRLRVATEYVELTRAWIERSGLDATIVRSHGATEVLPPEDADLIVDNAATGSTLEANGLVVFDELLRSSTRLFASRAAMDDPDRRGGIERFAMLLRSVLEARTRVMIEVNVDAERLEAVVEGLPCMRMPTIAALHHGGGYAVKVAVPRSELPSLIPAIRERGGTDIVVFAPEQIVP